jgi:transcriptional regulator with XRE-family HTH domain
MADNFFSELKLIREHKGVTLEEISDATLINLKMLQALERGEIQSLPQVYVRAFIREYAALIGLDKDETIMKYEAWLNRSAASLPASTEPTKQDSRKSVGDTSTSHTVGRGADASDTPSAAIEPTPPPAHEKPKLIEPVIEAPKKPSQAANPEAPSAKSVNRAQELTSTLMKIGLAIGALGLMNLLFWNVLEKESSPTTKEMPFLEAYKDQQERRGIIDSLGVDTTQRIAAPTGQSTPGAEQRRTVPQPFLSAGDSMTLVGTTTDSVWMEIVLDDDILTEHLLPPGSSISWRAKNEFWISAIGNPLSLKLLLNGKPIAIPYRKGYVTRDLRITRDSLQTR